MEIDNETPRSTNSNPGKRLRSKNAERKANPFEKELMSRLNIPCWSPSVLHSSEIEGTPPRFDWSIDEISKLNPAKIEDSPSSHIHTEDFSDSLEDKAQADIKHFFSQTVLPSPIECERISCLIRHSSSAEIDEEMDTSFRRKLQFTFEDSSVDMDKSDNLSSLSIFQHHGAYIASPDTDVPQNGPAPLRKFTTPSSTLSLSQNISGLNVEDMAIHCSTPNATG